MNDKRLTVQIIGSISRNRDEMELMASYLGTNGCIVLMPTMTDKIEGFEPDVYTHADMILAGLHKVEMADVIICMDKGKYIGQDTAYEIVYAKYLKKCIIYFYPEGIYPSTPDEVVERVKQLISRINNGDF